MWKTLWMGLWGFWLLMVDVGFYSLVLVKSNKCASFLLFSQTENKPFSGLLSEWSLGSVTCSVSKILSPLQHLQLLFGTCGFLRVSYFLHSLFFSLMQHWSLNIPASAHTLSSFFCFYCYLDKFRICCGWCRSMWTPPAFPHLECQFWSFFYSASDFHFWKLILQQQHFLKFGCTAECGIEWDLKKPSFKKSYSSSVHSRFLFWNIFSFHIHELQWKWCIFLHFLILSKHLVV